MVRFLTLTSTFLVGLTFADTAYAQCQGNLSRQNNLSDVCDAATARTNLGVGAGTVESITAGEGLTTTPGSFGGAITSTGTLYPVTQINAQTGTTYTVANTDCGKLVTFNNGSAVAVTLPQAGAASAFLNGCTLWFANIGAGNVTITPTTSTLDGLSSRVLQRYQGMRAVSNSTNYITGGVAPAVSADGIVDSDSLPTATAAVKGGVIAGSGLEMGGTGNKTISVTANVRTRTFNIVIDGGGSAITTGAKPAFEVGGACTITAWRVLSDQSGSIVVDIKKATYSGLATFSSIAASAKPTLSSAQKAENTTLTGWTTSVAAGDWIQPVVDSATTVTHATVSLTCVVQ